LHRRGKTTDTRRHPRPHRDSRGPQVTVNAAGSSRGRRPARFSTATDIPTAGYA
jgi:hypothetical protein